MDDIGVPRGKGFDWEDGEDLTTLCRRGLASKLESLYEDELARVLIRDACNQGSTTGPLRDLS